MLRSRFAKGLAAALLLAWAPAVKAQVFNPQTFTLQNGMQVVVVPNHRVPVASHMVWYRVGAADEPSGKSGLAHMLEHLMFKGTKDVPAGEFSRIVARNGGRDNAFTTSDYTGYYQNVAVDRLETVMKLESDRMVNLQLEEKNFLSERDVVLEERRSRTDNNPSALLGEQMEAVLFLNHPYHRPVIGWEAEVAKLSLQDATDFYRKYYAPNNAILVISGDVTAEQVKPLAEKYYGGLTPRDTPSRLRASEPPPVAARRVELRDAKVKQPAWNRTYLAPSYNRGATQYAYPLQVLAEVIGGGTTSQLFQNLVVKQQLATGAGAWYEPVAVDLSTFGIHASPRPGVSMEKIEAAILAEVHKIVTEGVPADEVERAKQRLKANVTYARDSYHTGANVLGQALTTGQTVADVEAWPQRIMTVTPQQVMDAARELFKDAQSVTGVLLPADETHTAAGKAG